MLIEINKELIFFGINGVTLMFIDYLISLLEPAAIATTIVCVYKLIMHLQSSKPVSSHGPFISRSLFHFSFSFSFSPSFSPSPHYSHSHFYFHFSFSMARSPHEYKSPRIVALFLVQFDTKTGYKLVWNKCELSILLSGIEYRAMPSGIHDNDSNTVFLVHKNGAKMLYGLSQFRNTIEGDEGDEQTVDRSKVKMYSLGILCEPASRTWKPNQYMSTGWEHIESLDSTLYTFMRKGDWNKFLVFDELYASLTSSHLSPNSNQLKSDHQLLSALPDLLDVLGPLVFVLYKQCLVRKRIMLFQHNPLPLSNFSTGSFTYLLSLISLISQDTATIQSNISTISPPLYNVGLHDLSEDDSLLKTAGSIAVTSDEILMYQDVYDVGVSLPADSGDHTRICFARGQATNFNDASSQLRATRQDLRNFRAAFKRFRRLKKRTLGTHAAAMVSSEELNSINTAGSNPSGLKQNWLFYDPHSEADEPQWWLEFATAPMSWREFIWSAFLWFASAGTVNREEASESSSIEDNATRYQQLIELITSFHRLTRKWFSMINDIVIQELENNGIAYTDGQPLDEKISIEVTYQDIYDMELDPYSYSDLQFIHNFVDTYWSEIVEKVQIGTGIGGFFC